MSVYHRALRSAETPEQRAAVAARYRQLFTAEANSKALAATVTHIDTDARQQCQEVTVTVAA